MSISNSLHNGGSKSGRHAARLVVVLSSVLACSVLASGASAQTPLILDAETPFKLARTPGGNFVLAESGTGAGDGMLSLITVWGGRLNLISALPSAITAEGGPSGPQGVAQAHTTLYIAMGVGDTIGETDPPRQFPNPDGPSSPLVTSVLRARFDPVPDGIREGFTLNADQRRRLADGHEVVIENGSGERVELLLLADLRDLEIDPVLNVRQSNPFAAEIAGSLTEADLIEFGIPRASRESANFRARLEPGSPLGQRLEERSTLYVIDAGMNTIEAIQAATGRRHVAARIPPLPNPLFPNLGGPVLDPVPTGIHVRTDGTLLVSVLSGFPFPTGSSRVYLLDPATGDLTPFITGLTTATDVLEANGAIYVLEFSTDFFANAPGRILRFATPGATPTVVAGGLISPSAFEYEPGRNELLVSETFTGRIVRVPLGN
jgi:hypothetical protein